MVNLADAWRDYLWDIYLKGHEHIKDDNDKIKEFLGVRIYLHRPQDFFQFSINSSKEYMDWVRSGAYNIPKYALKDAALYEYVNSWKNQKMIDGSDFVYTYPERLFHMKTVDKFTSNVVFKDQFQVIVERLKTYIGSNRAVATLYNVGLDEFEQHIPCLNFLQAIVRDNKLTLFCMFRSNDVFNAWPSNIMLLTHLGLLIADEFEDVEFEGIDYHCSSAHYYITEEPIIEEMFKWKL